LSDYPEKSIDQGPIGIHRQSKRLLAFGHQYLPRLRHHHQFTLALGRYIPNHPSIGRTPFLTKCKPIDGQLKMLKSLQVDFGDRRAACFNVHNDHQSRLPMAHH